MVLLSRLPRKLFTLGFSCLIILLFFTFRLPRDSSTRIPVFETFVPHFVPSDSDPITDLKEGITTSTPVSPTPVSPTPDVQSTLPTNRVVSENFPYDVKYKKLPAVHPLNAPPPPSERLETPLFIGFTRNWLMLQQSVVSYIAAGWPPDQIYIVDNTGTMDSNELGLLTLQNPFYVDYDRLRNWGVNMMTTPTLFTFAQLQNYYIYIALQKKWNRFFWSHMDSVVLSYEDREPYESLYSRILRILEKVDDLDKKHERRTWGMWQFSYDRLALVNVDAYKDVGGWDTMIPYYFTDCDMYARLKMRNYSTEFEKVGDVFDVAGVLEDLGKFFPNLEELEVEQEEEFHHQQLKEEKRDGDYGQAKIKGTTEKEVTESEAPKAPLTLLFSQSASTGKSNKYLSEFIDEPVLPSPTSPFTVTRLSGADKTSYVKTLNSPRYKALKATLQEMEISKNTAPAGRNFWQRKQVGGQGEPFYRDPDGFERALQMTIRHGAAVYGVKWGWEEGVEGSCDLLRYGRREEDAWARRPEEKAERKEEEKAVEQV